MLSSLNLKTMTVSFFFYHILVDSLETAEISSDVLGCMLAISSRLASVTRSDSFVV